MKTPVSKALEKAKGGKVFDPLSRKMVSRKPMKQQMGGSVTRNGVNVDKEIEEQTRRKYSK